MKSTLQVVALAGAVSGATSYLVASHLGPGEVLSLVAPAAPDSARVRDNSRRLDQVEALAARNQMRAAQGGRRAEAPGAGQATTDLEARIAELEVEVARLEREIAKAELGRPRGRAWERVAELGLDQKVSLYPAVGDNAGQEEFFNSAEGEANDVATAAIADTFFAYGDGVDLAGVECKSSLCKITYTSTDTRFERRSIEDEELLDGISVALGNVSYKATHKTDEYGNRIIYLQLD